MMKSGKDKTFHSCQIPLKLTKMLIESCTNENDSIFVLFGGSGGEIMLCETLKRKWISAELHKPYYDMILDRLNNNGEIRDEFKLMNFSQKQQSQTLF